MTDIESIWDDILDKDDRNSPEEYPDMVLITQTELKAIIDEAMAERDEEVTSAVNAGCLYGFGSGVNSDEAIERCAVLIDGWAQNATNYRALESGSLAAAVRALKKSDGGVEAQRHAAPMASVPAGETSGLDGVAAIPSEPVWLPIDTAPKNAKEVILRVPCKGWPDHYAIIAHYAEDLSGSDQPPFKGWFRNTGYGYAELSASPTGWMPFVEPVVTQFNRLGGPARG